MSYQTEKSSDNTLTLNANTIEDIIENYIKNPDNIKNFIENLLKNKNLPENTNKLIVITKINDVITITIKNNLIIDGTIDKSNIDIIVHGDLIVRGNIKQNTYITAKNIYIIGGVDDDCSLYSFGDINIESAGNNNTLTATKNIIIDYYINNNTTITAENGMIIAFIIGNNCTLNAKKDVLISSVGNNTKIHSSNGNIDTIAPTENQINFHQDAQVSLGIGNHCTLSAKNKIIVFSTENYCNLKAKEDGILIYNVGDNCNLTANKNIEVYYSTGYNCRLTSETGEIDVAVLGKGSIAIAEQNISVYTIEDSCYVKNKKGQIKIKNLNDKQKEFCQEAACIQGVGKNCTLSVRGIDVQYHSSPELPVDNRETFITQQGSINDQKNHNTTVIINQDNQQKFQSIGIYNYPNSSKDNYLLYYKITQDTPKIISIYEKVDEKAGVCPSNIDSEFKFITSINLTEYEPLPTNTSKNKGNNNHTLRTPTLKQMMDFKFALLSQIIQIFDYLLNSIAPITQDISKVLPTIEIAKKIIPSKMLPSSSIKSDTNNSQSSTFLNNTNTQKISNQSEESHNPPQI